MSSAKLFLCRTWHSMYFKLKLACSKKINISVTLIGGLAVNEVPQIVFITFDDVVNDTNWRLYEEIFLYHRTNPNGCSIRGTFYVSHEWTDYRYVQTLYSRGHEIASHSISLVDIRQTWLIINLVFLFFKEGVILSLRCYTNQTSLMIQPWLFRRTTHFFGHSH